ncbi:MAG: LecA/PA-IL family lectin, partial [Acidobacteriota bacterium]
QVKVLADNTNNGWTNSGFVVKKGQRISISGDGQIQLGKGHSSTPSGLADLNDDQKLLKSVPTGALIAVIGDDNNEFIYVGSEREFTATRDGALFLGVNEGYLDDNSGAYSVKIQILPDNGK